MKILHYNILDGFESNSERIALFVEWLRHCVPDVISLNEYRTTDERLQYALVEAGYSHAVINTSCSSINRCAIFSRLPLMECEMAKEFRFLRVKIGALDLISYHASPRGVAAVLSELELLWPRLDGRRNVVLVGDFNSLCPADCDRIYRTEPMQRPGERYLLNGVHSPAFIDGLMRPGFRDVNISQGEEGATVPTKLPRPHESGLAVRLDYAFARLESFEASSRVIRDPVFDRLSDHYPVLVTLKPHAS